MLHRLTHDRANLHANFVAGASPVLSVESGDTVELPVPDVSWGLEAPTSTTAPRRKVEPRDPKRCPALDDGPCLVGPIAVRGALPGDAIEISIERVVPGTWGWTYAGGGMATPAWNRALGIGDSPLALLRWSLTHNPLCSAEDSRNADHSRHPDTCTGVATNHLGHKVPLRPFPGTIGLAPAVARGQPYESGWVPRACGGNMDCRELVAGSTLFLPVMVEGGMLSVGDGHAAQGDGEVSGTAIECMLEEVRITLTLHRGMRLQGPRILGAPESGSAWESSTGEQRQSGGILRRRWMTLGFGETLDHAAAMAMSGMLDLMEQEFRLPRAECAALASCRVSLRVTQLVNPRKGVHAILMD